MADITQTDAGQGDTSPTEATDKTVQYWNRQIDRYNRAFASWVTRAEKVIKIYTEERRIEHNAATSPRKLSLLWSNISTLKPAIYARLPHPDVSRRFKDSDPVARAASEMLERALSYSFDRGRVDDTIDQVVDDFLLASRGTAWVRYEAEFEPITGPDGEPLIDPSDPENPQPMEQIASERVVVDYVHWRDFGHVPARTWQEVPAVWRVTYLTRSKIAERFGKDKAEKVTLDFKGSDDPGNNYPLADGDKKATVYEIWDKDTKKVYFIAKSCPEPLEVADPYLDLDGFFPCPKPAYGTLQDSSLIPVPDYVYYQDQIEEIDALTARIGKLTDALKLVGFYPQGPDSQGSSAIEKALDPGTDMRMVPVPSWAAFAEKGGANQIQWFPVEKVQQVIQACVVIRKQMIEDIYQVTGLSDIMRGESDPNDTATAQRIKGQWGSIRTRDRQAVIARFIGDIAQIAGEIIADKFQPETLMDMSNLKLPTQQEVDQQIQAAQQAAMMQAMQQQAQAQSVTVPTQGVGGPLSGSGGGLGQ